jgi:hypothetical protein
MKLLDSFKYPYSQPIKYFQQLEKVRAPLHKLKIILKTAELIDQCIREFYQAHSPDYNTKRMHYDADEFISIFMYIIV